jgi:hypothetical protein
MFLSDKSQAGICTGVAVSHNAVLIAGHCVKDGTIDWSVRSPDTGVDAKKIVMWTQLINRQRMSMQDASRDLAVLVYPPNALKPPYAVVAQSLPKAGTPVKVVGYGATSFDSQASLHSGQVGRKNSGTNQIKRIEYSACDEDISNCRERVIVTHAGVNPDGTLSGAAAAPGDSGSPIFLMGAPGGEQTPTVVGIGAAVGARDRQGALLAPIQETDGEGKSHYKINFQGTATIENLYVDVTSPASATILQLATCFGAEIPGYEPKSNCEKIPEEDAVWMQKPSPDFIGAGNYVGIASFLETIMGFLFPSRKSADSSSTSADSSSSASISVGQGPSGFLQRLFSGLGFGVKTSDSATASTDTKRDEDKKEETKTEETKTENSVTQTVTSPDGSAVAQSSISTGPAAVTTASSSSAAIPAVVANFAKDNSAFWNAATQAANAPGNKLTQTQKDQINAMATSCGGNIDNVRGCDPGSVWKIIGSQKGSVDTSTLDRAGQALNASKVAMGTTGVSTPASSVSAEIFTSANPKPAAPAAAPSAPAAPIPANAKVGAAANAASAAAAAKPQPAGAVAVPVAGPAAPVTAQASPRTTQVASTVVQGAAAAARAPAPMPAAAPAPKPAAAPAPKPAAAPAPKPAAVPAPQQVKK